MQNQYSFNDAQIAKIKSITSNGTKDFAKGYQYITELVETSSSVSERTKFWFKNAAEINSNDPQSTSNTFIRAVTRAGLTIDGKAADDATIQAISDDIGVGVFKELLGQRGIPTIDYLVSQDISASIEKGGETYAGWGGAFYYFDLRLDNGTTVGDAIMSSVSEREKFYAAATKGTLEVFNKHGYTAKTLLESIEAGWEATTPLVDKAEIFARFATSSPVGSPNNIDGWLYDKTSNTWFSLPEELGGFYPIIADQDTANDLNKLKGIREDQRAKLNERRSELDPVYEMGSNGERVIKVTDAYGSEKYNKAEFAFLHDGNIAWTSLDFDDGTKTKTSFDNEGIERIREETSDDGDRTATFYDSSHNSEGKIEYNNVGTIDSVSLQARSVAASEMGELFGSLLGKSLGNGNAIAEIGLGTLLGLTLSKVGTALQAGLEGDLSNFVDNFLKSSTEQLGGNIGGLQGDIVNRLSGIGSALLSAELADALDIKGFNGQIFTTAVNGVTSEFIKTAASLALDGRFEIGRLFSDVGMSAGKIIDGIEGGLGSLFGSQLGSLIVTPESPEAALFGSVGSSIGGIAGTAIGVALSATPFIGPFIGAFLGQVLGTIIGNITEDNDDIAYVYLDVNEYGELSRVHEWIEDKGNITFSRQMSSGIILTINDMLKKSGMHLDREAKIYTELGYYNTTNERLFLRANGHQIELDSNSKDDHSPSEIIVKKLVAEIVQSAMSQVIDRMAVVGGDPIMRRAFYASRAQSTDDDSVVALGFDMQVAQDYRFYLEHKGAIHALLEAAPKSAFAAGWLATLARVNELGINHGSANDFRGGHYVNLKDIAEVQGPHSFGEALAPERLAWVPDLEASDISSRSMDTGNLILRSPEGLAEVTVEDVFGPGRVRTVVGGDNERTVDARDLNDKHASVILIKAGDGDKRVFGPSDAGAIIVGGKGDQTIRGGSGNDWIRGGNGNSELIGNEGDDLLVAGTGDTVLNGGEGRNTYYLGKDDASVEISKLDRNDSDTVIASLVGARAQHNIITISANSSIKGSNIVYDHQSAFSRENADLVIMLRSADDIKNVYVDTGSGFYSEWHEYPQDGDYKKLVIKNFFLSDSGIDEIRFEDGTVLSNAQIWRKAGVNVRVNDAWNNSDRTNAVLHIDTKNEDPNSWDSRLITENGREEKLFDVRINDDGGMITTALDLLKDHDWDRWYTSYARSGTVDLESVILDDGTSIRNLAGIIAGDVGDDVLQARAAGGDVIGDRGNDTLIGSGNSDSLYGNSGNDRLIGNDGRDFLYGGTGNDIYVIENAYDEVFEKIDEGSDLIESSVTYSLGGTQVENLTLTGRADIDATGNSLANDLMGNEGINTLIGGDGNDTLNGGGGADLLSGGDGNDRLVGGGGIDILKGGDGSDTYLFTGSETIVEKSGEGTGDTIESTVSYELGEINVERVTLLGSSDLKADGNRFNNVLTGNEGNNVLFGKEGNDVIDGGSGWDIAFYKSFTGDIDYVAFNGKAVVRSKDDGIDVLNSIEYLSGSDGLNIEVQSNFLQYIASHSDLRALYRNRIDTFSLAPDEVLSYFQNTSDTAKQEVTFRAWDYLVDNRGVLNDFHWDAEAAARHYILWGRSGGLTYTFDSLKYIASYSDLSNDLGTSRYSGARHYVDIGQGQGREITFNPDSFMKMNNDVAVFLNYDKEAATRWFITYGYAQKRDWHEDGRGYDVLIGTSANDTLRGFAGNDRLDGAGGQDTLDGGDGDDQLLGASGNDMLNGGSGNDTLDGGTGADTMGGGTGDDTYAVDNVADTVKELSGEGMDVVNASVSFSIAGQHVEILNLIGSGDLDGTGNGLGNTIVGTSGNNVLDGGGGADTLKGGLGNDTYIVDNAGDVVVEAANEGTDTIESELNVDLGGMQVERVVLRGTANVKVIGNGFDNALYGNDGANTLVGGAGNDTLNGGGGADTMRGGTGDDSYTVNDAGDVVTEESNEGTDLVRSSVTFSLAGKQLENLTLLGAADINATGNSFANILIGNSGANVIAGGAGNDSLDGGEGADALKGGTGDDTYFVDNVADTVEELSGEGTDLVNASVSFSIAGQHIERLSLIGIGNINGTGNGLGNTIDGTKGNNILDGGAGSDMLIGGLGDDTYIVDNTGDVITENANEGTDTVETALSFSLGGLQVERIVLTGTTDATATGNSFDNALYGNDGANTLVGKEGDDWLDGRGGADTMTGGVGNDTYVVNHTGDVVTEAANEGTDLVRSSVSYSLSGKQIENLTLLNSVDINATGNSIANILIGNAGANVINGGTGSDTLTGGLGTDTFAFSSTLGTSNVDLITDFLVVDDGIQVAKSVFTALTAESWAEAAFKDLSKGNVDASDRIIYDRATGALTYDADGSGTASTAIQFAIIDNRAALTYADIIVV